MVLALDVLISTWFWYACLKGRRRSSFFNIANCCLSNVKCLRWLLVINYVGSWVHDTLYTAQRMVNFLLLAGLWFVAMWVSRRPTPVWAQTHFWTIFGHIVVVVLDVWSASWAANILHNIPMHLMLTGIEFSLKAVQIHGYIRVCSARLLMVLFLCFVFTAKIGLRYANN
jgi:hypothetical protein